MRHRGRQRKAGRPVVGWAALVPPTVTLTPAAVTDGSLTNFPQVANLVATWDTPGTATVTVDWGDGVGVQSFAGQASGVDVVTLVTPQYMTEDTYTATVTVNPNATGLTGSKTATIVVGP